MQAKLIGFVFLFFGLMGAGFWTPKEKRSPVGTATDYTIDTLATGLTVPWSIVFLPDKTMLFSERSGKVGLLRNKRLADRPALVVADVEARGKMGLLGMCLHPRFALNKFLYLSYNYRKEGAAMLKVVRYRFEKDSLLEPLTIIDDIRASTNHTGCRLKFGPDGKLYITTGDADRPILAQDLKSPNGKILRVNDDGSIPADNPFVQNDTARKEIWTYGHRNPQGIAFEPTTGQLFDSEHGPTGGDEINRIVRGQNYGWPLVHHREEREGMTAPVMEYTPSIGPSEMVFYTADAFPALKGKLLLACLRGEKILQLQLDRTKVVSEEILLQGAYRRIRALTVGPDGYLYFSTSQNDPPEGRPTEGYDMILRMRPAGKPTTMSKVTGKPVARKTAAMNTIGTAANGKPASATARRTPAALYLQLCASCHGKNLEGTERASSLRDNKWQYGSKRSQVINSITDGITEKGMPAWQGALSPKEIESLTDYLLARPRRK